MNQTENCTMYSITGADPGISERDSCTPVSGVHGERRRPELLGRSGGILPLKIFPIFPLKQHFQHS